MKFNSKNIILIIVCLLMLSMEFDYSIIMSNNTNFRQVSLAAAILLSFSPFLFEKYYKLRISNAIYLFLLYFLYCLLSIAWSFSAKETIISCVGLLICLVAAMNISRVYAYKEFLKAFLIAIAITAIISWLLYFSSYKGYTLNKEDFFRFKGVYMHTQRLALLSGVGLICCMSKLEIFKNKWLNIFMMLLFALTLFLTKARALITFSILVGILINFHLIKKHLKKAIWIFALLIIPLLTLNITTYIYSLYERGDDDLTELTGRTLVWNAIIPQIMQKPLLGHGFGAFRQHPVHVGNYVPDHAHNIWLHQAYETGFLGAILLTVFLFYCVYISFQFQKKCGVMLVSYLTLLIIIAGITGLPIGGNASPLYFMLLACVCFESNLRRYRIPNSVKN